jgi:hypothetical protein
MKMCCEDPIFVSKKSFRKFHAFHKEEYQVRVTPLLLASTYYHIRKTCGLS